MNELALSSLNLTIGGGTGTTEVAAAMKIFLFLTILSLAPAILLTMTSFTRIVVVLSFLRQAMGVAQSPPNQVLVGLALFLSVFLMAPVLKQVHEEAVSPFMAGQMDYKAALDKASTPLKRFMFAQTRQKDIELLLELSKGERPKDLSELSMSVMMPAFVLSELKTAFEIGFLIYLPFVMIDMVVAMVLLTMGMMVLPPIIVSLPFKIMLFVLVDGWNLVVGSLLRSFK
ncbi:MAG: flagellar type III secretion system pore protein FliP [Deltaproteobacteria bacterium]|nr:flagellar type III secretion system pore protein FliP [Deltaproteobacteria bacterium]